MNEAIITAIRVHINAVNALLDMLQQADIQQREQVVTENRERVCPQCGSSVVDVSLNNTPLLDREYQCPVSGCGWEGQF